MPPILALEKISKRFGAVVVADGHRPRARARARRSASSGRTAPARPRCSASPPAPSPPDAGRVIFDGADITRAAARAALPPGHRALVPDPAAVRRHDRVREPRGRGRLRRRPQRARRLRPLRRAARATAALPTRPTGRPAASRCSIASGSSSRARSPPRPRVLLLDEVAGGLTEHECARAGRADPRHARAAACRSSGSSMSCMRCIAVVDRLVVLHGGGFIAAGRSADRDQVSPRCARSIWGSPADA